jgi:hypothetical protein
MWIAAGQRPVFTSLFMTLVLQVEGYVFKQLLIVDGEKPSWCRCLWHAPVPQGVNFQPLDGINGFKLYFPH